MPSEIDSDSTYRAINYNFGTDVPFNERRNYGKILEFFADEEAFTDALRLVSRDLWVAYNRYGYMDLNGRFTKALRDVAAVAGFAYPDFTVFTGPLHPPTFINHVRQGYFWKDSFAPEHGEFSHAFQWLAIKKHFGKHLDAPRLYRRTADIKSVVPIFNFDQFRRGISMWPWLCDCFPMRHFNGGVVTGDAEENFSFCNSDTFRLPNAVESLVRNSPADWFIGAIIRYRQNKNDNDGGVVRAAYGNYLRSINANKKTRNVLRDNMAMISMAQSLRKERDTVRYTPHATGAPIAAPNPKSRIWHRDRPTYRAERPDQERVTFHGIEGWIPTHVLNNNPPALVLTVGAPLRAYEGQDTVPLTQEHIG